jgi:hypothetical protein
MARRLRVLPEGFIQPPIHVRRFGNPERLDFGMPCFGLQDSRWQCKKCGHEKAEQAGEGIKAGRLHGTTYADMRKKSRVFFPIASKKRLIR